MFFQLETNRLLLREVTPQDLAEMYALHSDPLVQEFTGEAVIGSREEMAKTIDQRVLDYKKYGFGRWAVILKESNEFVGWAGLAYLEEFDEIDVGYRFKPEFWGMGIATESSRAVVKYGFETLKLKRIIAIAMKENEASLKVMEKIGMQFDKFAPYEPGGEDVVWYVLERGQYKRQ